MNKEIKAKWVADLRSGEYRQIKETLRNRGKGRCCLGVLAEVNGAKWESDVVCYVTLSGPVKDSHRSEGLYWGQKTGLTQEQAEFLANANDTGMTFAEIADWIEENL